MGLSKSFTLSTGVVATYVDIMDIFQNPKNNMCRVSCGLYLDYASKVAGKDPVFVKTYTVSGANNPLSYANWVTGKNSWQILYPVLKATQAELNGSVDVLEAGQTT